MSKLPNSSGAYLGFDCASFPGNATMQAWWDHSPYGFVGFYLQAPCHAHYIPWEGHRAELVAMGWALLVVYLGQQRAGNGCGCNRLTTSQGKLDAEDAAKRSTSQGFPNGTCIYLDIEGGDPYGPDLAAYLGGWVPTLTANGFSVGVYCGYHLAHDIQRALAALSVPNARFWITGQKGNLFNRDSSIPTNNPSGMGVAWQSFPHNETWGGVSMNVDSSVSSLQDPSAAAPSVERANVEESFVVASDLVHDFVAPIALQNSPTSGPQHSSATIDPASFRIAINMAGAISAGAYTAGVLDFLLEALEEWQSAKDSFKKQLANPGTSITNAVPLHDVCIDCMTGASAGGMCAAISAVMMQSEFQHIRTGDEQNTNNVFYESWVNDIDIKRLLEAQDLKDGPLRSLLDCTVIDEIAASALKLKTPVPRPYVAPDLSLFLMLTNIRGVTYPLYTDVSQTLEEKVAFFGDKVEFQIVQDGGQASSSTAKPLPLSNDATGAWPLLTEAAKATGAFPIFLAPRRLTRDIADYASPDWSHIYDKPPAPGQPPSPELPSPPVWDTLNVDGGMTDNDPMEVAYDFLAMNNPMKVVVNGRVCNPEKPDTANCTVLSVSPFPGRDKLEVDYFQQKTDPAGIFNVLGKLFSLLLAQSRFFGESLADVANGATFNHFMIAPSGPESVDTSALQCSCLGAFGGFFDRRFRKHDFLLGRRNCQRFLEQQFALPLSNPVITSGMDQAGGWAGSVQQFFKRGPLDGATTCRDQVWIPIIPLCGTARAEVPDPVRETMTEADLDTIVSGVLSRLQSVRSPLLEGAPGVVRWLAGLALAWPASIFIKKSLKQKLWQLLGDNISPPAAGTTPTT